MATNNDNLAKNDITRQLTQKLMSGMVDEPSVIVIAT